MPLQHPTQHQPSVRVLLTSLLTVTCSAWAARLKGCGSDRGTCMLIPAQQALTCLRGRRSMWLLGDWGFGVSSERTTSPIISLCET